MPLAIPFKLLKYISFPNLKNSLITLPITAIIFTPVATILKFIYSNPDKINKDIQDETLQTDTSKESKILQKILFFN